MAGMVGKLAFVVGMLFAIFGGIFGGVAAPTNHAVIWILLIAGILIGLLNITHKEAPIVLSAFVAMIILALWANSSAFWPIGDISTGLAENIIGIADALAILLAPAAIIVVFKAIFSTAKPGD